MSFPKRARTGSALSLDIEIKSEIINKICYPLLILMYKKQLIPT